MNARRHTIIHASPIRVIHWLNVLTILAMTLSGWRIYNASPLFDFSFPRWITLGGWLAGALQWHFAMMWLLIIINSVYLAYGVLTGHFRKKFLPVSKAESWNNFKQALTCKLQHKPGTYNSLQRTSYLGSVFLIILLVASGLATWKPVQLHWLAWLMGDYEGARLVHFFAMSLLMLFVAVHVSMALLVPKTLLSIITGKVSVAATPPAQLSYAEIPSTEAGDAL
ncbi:MAG: cytochrome b/b6 domain-containing protein [Pseudomonadota bacterium]